MINVAIIDDEQLALENLGHFLSDYDDLNIVGAFTHSKDFLKCLENNKVDLVFLDIEMPEITGLELASIIMDKFPDIQVVFATAYNQYAVEAFEISALDYVLKPISRKRLDKTMERVRGRIPSLETKIYLKCLGGFDIYRNGKVIDFTQSKAKEILAYLVNCQGKSVGWMTIADAVWPDCFDDKKLMNNFHVACHALRTFLNENGIEEIFEYSRNLYRVNIEKFDCDIYQLFDTYKKVRSGIKAEFTPEDFNTGEYFENLNYIWSFNMAERIKKTIRDLNKVYSKQIKKLSF